jgi:hypothetical protein
MLSLHASIESPRLHFEPRKLTNLGFNADPNPAVHSNADPDPAPKNIADPDSKFAKISSVPIPIFFRSIFFHRIKNTLPDWMQWAVVENPATLLS